MGKQDKEKTSLQHDYNGGFLNNVSQTLADSSESITVEYEGKQNEEQKNK